MDVTKRIAVGVVVATLALGGGIANAKGTPQPPPRGGPSPDTPIVPVTLAEFQRTAGDADPTWPDECAAYGTWMEWIDQQQLQGSNRLNVQEMLDGWYVAGAEYDGFRLTNEARAWYIDKLHSECANY